MKVKGLIRDMIEKLEAQAGTEATEKAYCDEQVAARGLAPATHRAPAQSLLLSPCSTSPTSAPIIADSNGL